MIRFRLKEVMADYEFKNNRNLTLAELAQATGIARGTLSKIANEKGASVLTSNIDQLCGFFGCRVEDLMSYLPDEDAGK